MLVKSEASFRAESLFVLNLNQLIIVRNEFVKFNECCVIHMEIDVAVYYCSVT